MRSRALRSKARMHNSMSAHRIAIFDNDPTVALVTQRGIERMLPDGVEVVVVPSPSAAREYCLANDVDLLIVDPGASSQTTIKMLSSLREERPQTAVLALAAYDTPRLRAQLRLAGVVHYLAKPVELRQIADTVNSILGTTPITQPGKASSLCHVH
jgi:DNA-binding NarL/FixJ family response regulator